MKGLSFAVSSQTSIHPAYNSCSCIGQIRNFRLILSIYFSYRDMITRATIISLCELGYSDNYSGSVIHYLVLAMVTLALMIECLQLGLDILLSIVFSTAFGDASLVAKFPLQFPTYIEEWQQNFSRIWDSLHRFISDSHVGRFVLWKFQK